MRITRNVTGIMSQPVPLKCNRFELHLKCNLINAKLFYTEQLTTHFIVLCRKNYRWMEFLTDHVAYIMFLFYANKIISIM